MFRETAYTSLKRIADIEDSEARKVALRQTLMQNNALAIIVQRTYHPNYNFDLPAGDLPGNLAKRSNHDEAGPFYNSLKKWYVFRPAHESIESAGIKKHVKEAQFIDLYEAIASNDVEILIGVKDKKLPFETLNAEFVVSAIPELFPDGFNPSESKQVTNVNEVENTPPITFQEQPVVNQAEVLSEYQLDHTTDPRTKKEICRDIMERNPGLTRKEYLKLFEEVGVKAATAGLYYQALKDKVNK